MIPPADEMLKLAANPTDAARPLLGEVLLHRADLDGAAPPADLADLVDAARARCPAYRA